MALTTTEQRAALLDVASWKAKQTSFPKQLAPGPTILTVTKKNTTSIQQLQAVITNPPKPKDITIVAKLPKGTGFHPDGYYFGEKVTFALGPQSTNTPSPALDPAEYKDWGRHFSDSITNPGHDTIYMVRYELIQPRVEPLLGGFIFHFIRPLNWAWADGQSTDIPVQVASNPVILVRLVKSPTGTIVNTGFTVRVKAFYP